MEIKNKFFPSKFKSNIQIGDLIFFFFFFIKDIYNINKILIKFDYEQYFLIINYKNF